MNVSLSPELERRIAEKVDSGLYTTASEVVREALRLFFAESEARERRLTQLEADLAQGLKELDRGEGIPVDQLRKELTGRRAGRGRSE
jgi:antitoxin ParD1/3/4